MTTYTGVDFFMLFLRFPDFLLRYFCFAFAPLWWSLNVKVHFTPNTHSRGRTKTNQYPLDTVEISARENSVVAHASAFIQWGARLQRWTNRENSRKTKFRKKCSLINIIGELNCEGRTQFISNNIISVEKIKSLRK